MDIRTAIEVAGGLTSVADACGITKQAIYKWIYKGRLPATEWTGETRYAEIISGMINARDIPGAHVSPLDLCPGAGPYMQPQEKEAA